MKECIICKREIQAKEMIRTGHKPTNQFVRGVMHTSCYQILKVFKKRDGMLPIEWFLMGIVFMVMILAPGIIEKDNSLVITSFVVLLIVGLTSIWWFFWSYVKVLKRCRQNKPIEKREDVHEYVADFNAQTKEFNLKEESFDYYHDHTQDPTHNLEWALKVMSLAPRYSISELEDRFNELADIYQSSEANGYSTSRMKELLQAMKILQSQGSREE